MNLQEMINSLSDEDKVKLIEQLKDNAVQELPDVPKKRGRPSKKLKMVEDEEQPVSRRRVQRITIDDEEEEEKIGSSRVIKSTMSQPARAKSSKVAGRRESFQTGPRPNEFEDSVEFGLDKQDAKIDNALWQGRQPTPRNRPTVSEVQCTRCRRFLEVGPGLAHGRYVCDDCIPARGN